MGRNSTQFDSLKKRRFLVALSQTGNISAAARAARCDRTTHYKWLWDDREYANRAQDAIEEGIEALEFEARRRALKCSDVLLIFLLKAARPEKYRDRYSIQHSARQPEAVEPALSAADLTDDELREIIEVYGRAELRQKRCGESNDGIACPRLTHGEHMETET